MEEWELFSPLAHEILVISTFPLLRKTMYIILLNYQAFKKDLLFQDRNLSILLKIHIIFKLS